MDEPRLEKMVDLLEQFKPDFHKRMAFLALHTGQMDGKKQKDHSAAEIHRDGFREHVSAHDRADRRGVQGPCLGLLRAGRIGCNCHAVFNGCRDIISRWRWVIVELAAVQGRNVGDSRHGTP